MASVLAPCASEEPNKTFVFNDLEVELLDPSMLKPKPAASQIRNGKDFTDYMLEMNWEVSNGWSKPRIVPFHNLSISPAAKVLNYAVELFDSLKAFRGIDGKVRLFRPELNIKRILRGAEQMVLPSFCEVEFLKCIQRFISIEQNWIPQGETSALYIRVVFIGTEATMIASASRAALLYVIVCPIAPYDIAGYTTPLNILADPQYIRAWPGGWGDAKFGANYGPQLRLQTNAAKAGYEQILYLFGENHQVTEIGTMNIFIYLKNQEGENELVTPPLDGLILPGITRQSVLELTREWGDFEVSERPIFMKEFVDAHRNNRIHEVFTAGTVRTICQVGTLSYMDVNYDISGVPEESRISGKILKYLLDIFTGRTAHHAWSILV